MKFISQVYTKVSGSVGGITYLTSRGGAMVARARVRPVNPNTTNQNVARSAFNRATLEWKNLTDAARTAWAGYAATRTYEGPLGNYKITGRQTFISIIQQMTYVTWRGIQVLTPVFTAPILQGWLSLGLLAVTDPDGPSETGFKVNVHNASEEAVYAISKISPPQSPTVQTYHGPFLSDGQVSQAVAADAAAAIEFLGLVEGQVYFVKSYPISQTGPFRNGNPIVVRAVAVAVGP